MEPIDKFDRAIIHELERDGRMTLTRLASRVGLSKSPCQARMKRLEAEGYIRGYAALIDQTKLGRDHVAFAQVTLKQTSSQALRSFNEAIAGISAVEQCHMIAGNFDYLLKIRTRNMDEYREILGEKISSLPYVQQSSTFVVMQAVKDP